MVVAVVRQRRRDVRHRGAGQRRQHDQDERRHRVAGQHLQRPVLAEELRAAVMDLREQGVLILFRGQGGEYLADGGADRGVDDDVGRCGDFGEVAGERAADGVDFGAVADGPQAGGESPPRGGAPAKAPGGAHFSAQPPLHMLLPPPAGSLSKVYSVMPAWSVSMPPEA